MSNLSIYVHIPFCNSKCNYCNFVSGKFDDKTIDLYFKKLIKEIKSKADVFKNKEVVSIYFGGGTPSSVGVEYIQSIVQCINNNYNISENCEISIEVNPCSATKEKFEFYKSIGINRISIGVQSLSNRSLKIIGRRHTADEAMHAIKLAKDSGIDNISCDFLIGIPYQSKIELIDGVDKVIGLGVKHISAYMLILEQNTLLNTMVDNGEIEVASEDVSINLYEELLCFLRNKGYHRYEISNFCEKGYECLHNERYWSLDDYVGFGLSAHSYYNGVRYANTCNMTDYLNESYCIQEEMLTQEQKYEEYIMLSLRTIKGIDIEYLKNEFNFDILKLKFNEIEFLKINGFVKINDRCISLTDRGFEVCNQIILKLI